MFFLTEQNFILKLQKDFYFSGSVNLSIIESACKTTRILCIYLYAFLIWVNNISGALYEKTTSFVNYFTLCVMKILRIGKVKSVVSSHKSKATDHI